MLHTIVFLPLSVQDSTNTFVAPLQATASFLGKRLSHCVVETVPGAEHLALRQSPKEFVGLVHKHLCRMAGIEQPQVESTCQPAERSPCGS